MKRLTNAFRLILLSISLLSVATLLVYFFSPLIQYENSQPWALISIVIMMGFANEIFTPTSMSIITQTGTGRFRQTQIAILLVFIQLSNLTRFLISYNYTEAQSLNPMDSRILFTGIASVLLLAITLVMLRILKPDKPPSVK